MSRWIDADALELPYGYCEDASECYKALGSLPSIEIIRCRECKYASDNKVYGCMLNHFNDDEYHRMYADDFCSRGEREGE